MSNQVHLLSKFIRRWTCCAVLMLLVLVSAGCRNEGSGAGTATPVATPANGGAQGQLGAAMPAGSPSPAPSNPVGPVGQTTPSGTPNQQLPSSGDQQLSMGGIPATSSPAKPGITPAPDPFPPRPTPPIVMKDGKIVQPWQAPAEALSLVNPVKNSPDALKLGREFYMQRCVDCHGKEGKGNGWLSKGVFKPPTNLASQVVQANSDGELCWKITNGKSPMPANRIRFTDEQRWQIVTYLRTFKP